MGALTVGIGVVVWLAAYVMARRLAAPRLGAHRLTGQAQSRRGGGGRVRPSPALPSDVLAIGGIAAAAALFFWRLVVGGAWMPEGGGDNAGFLLPLFRYAQAAVRAGEVPLWNARQYTGAPFAADIQTGLFYPVNALAVLLAPKITYGWMEALAVVHYLVAGVGMYALLRLHRGSRAGVRPVAALVGALAFMFSDVFVTHFGNLNLIAAAAWLPWVFLGIHRATERDGGRTAWAWSLAAAGFIGLAGLAGHAQPLVYILGVAAAYALIRTVAALWPPRRPDRHALAIPARAAVALVLGLAIAAVALVPAYELMGETRRAELDMAAAAEYSLPVELLSGLVAPGLFGRGMQHYWGPWPRVESGYLGVVTLVLAVTALVLRRRGSRGVAASPVVALAAMAVLALAVALGPATPLSGWLHDLVPGMAGLRAPARAVLVVDFALAMLAGIGLDGLLRVPRRRRPAVIGRALAWTAALALVLTIPGVLAAAGLLAEPTEASAERIRGLVVALSVAGAAALAAAAALTVVGRARGNARAWAWLLPACLFAELFVTSASLDWIDWDPSTNLDPPAMSFLVADRGVYRIEIRPEVWGWWSPSAALANGIDDAGGVYNPLRLARPQLYWESLTDRAHRRYDFLNVKYVVGPKDFALPWDRFVPVHDADPNVNVYLNLQALPRALFVPRAVVVADEDAAWRAVQALDFDPTREVVIEEGQALAAAPTRPAREAEIEGGPASGTAPTRPAEQSEIEGEEPLATAPTRPARVDIAGYRANQVDVTVDTEAAGYLVVSDAYYPGWHAEVDGRPVEVVRANYAYKAVPVPPGRHAVRLWFAPTSVAVGGALSVVGLLLVGAGLVWAVRRRPRPTRPAQRP